MLTEIFTVVPGLPPSVGSILYACLQVVVTALGAFLVDRVRRKTLVMVKQTAPRQSTNWDFLLVKGPSTSTRLGPNTRGHRHPGIHRLLRSGNGCSSLGYNVRDIPNKREPSNIGELVWFLGGILHFQLSHELEDFISVIFVTMLKDLTYTME
ncbi:hypothetical protein HHK36_020686 [Tetracentron sinense]|uniref:Uncharacterized protein n=1 Tax=Tetracentron sinense TaxID=13715 RepID=A0A834YY45_TETSI|nr:hypothetical protein HHK36_020686 [Tetracentron sinense]